MNAKKSVRILVCTGHTGGHFFPALNFSEAFCSLRPEVEIHFLVNRVAPFAEPFLKDGPLQFRVIPLTLMPNFFSFKMFPFLLKCASAFWKTFFLFFKIKPDLVIGFGSFGSVPSLACGILLRTPILLHEQNAAMGRANQFFSRFASKVAVSFPKTQGKCPPHRIFWSGYPLRAPFLKGFDQFPEPSKNLENPFTILVFGGSQGASRLNEIVMSSLHLLRAEERADFAVIHIVGNPSVNEFESRYRTLGIQANVYGFSYRISEHYKDAHLVISRAGAGTIFELAAVGRAAILVPYPHAYAHQKINAEYLAQNNAAYIVDESSLSAGKLLEIILGLRENRDRRMEFQRNIKTLFKPEASRILAETAWELICKRN